MHVVGRKLMYDPDDIEYIREILPGRPYVEACKLFSEHVGYDVSLVRFSSLCKKRKIHNGLDMRYAEKYKSKHYASGKKRYRCIKVEGVTHRMSTYIWEQAYGPVPKGYRLVFKDGDGRNCTLDNLVMLPNNVAGTLFKYKLVFDDPAKTETGILIAKLIVAIKKRKKELRNARYGEN